MAPRMCTAGFAVVSMRCSLTELRGLTTDSKNDRVFDGGDALAEYVYEYHVGVVPIRLGKGDLEISVLVGTR
jgi:hypothetical protein